MSKSSEMHLAEMEAAAYHNSVEELTNLINEEQMIVQSKIDRPALTEAEYLADRALEVALIKAQSNLLAVGIVTAITPVKSLYNASFKVSLDHGTYFYNSTLKDPAAALILIKKMLPVGQKVAFQFKETKTGSYNNKVIQTIFYTF